MQLETLQDLYVHELKDLYSAEKQLIRALPEMAKAAKNGKLAAGFEEHLEQTKEHAARLERRISAFLFWKRSENAGSDSYPTKPQDPANLDRLRAEIMGAVRPGSFAPSWC